MLILMLSQHYRRLGTIFTPHFHDNSVLNISLTIVLVSHKFTNLPGLGFISVVIVVATFSSLPNFYCFTLLTFHVVLCHVRWMN
jgi:hypothetical protein